ncbi:LLM class F420-dependent oxidoreductase [Nocardia sp. CA-128927]|uniref:LLM class F420-dependent oxidoreductase n=1 Tax=Nocardia sp. CA-128927 TaxID=3239975 RepID=UPI003D95CD1D
MDFGVSAFVTDESIRPDLLGIALEERGFTSLSLAEHSNIPASRKSPYPGGGDLPRRYYRTMDPFVALTAAAAATRTLRVGTGIAQLIQRDVFHTAKEVASLDIISGGRFDFGVGVGWNREEMRNHGTDPRTQGTLLNERLAALKAIWTQDEAEFHGKYVDFDPVFVWPKPLQKPHPPIYISSVSPAALARVAEYGDGWLPTLIDPAGVRQGLQWLADQGRTGIKVTVWGVRDPGMITGYAEAGVHQVNMLLPSKPEDKTYRALDELATLADGYR